MVPRWALFIVFLFSFFQTLLCFYDCPIKHEHWCELQPREGNARVCLWWGGNGLIHESLVGGFLFYLVQAQASGTVSWLGVVGWNPESGSLAMMVDTWSDCAPVYILVHKQPFTLSFWLPGCLGWFS